MIKGRVTPAGDPLVPIALDLGSHQKTFQAIVDTGFNGYLSVPESLARKGGWYFFGTEDYELATGDVVRQRIYVGKIVFDGRLAQVYAVTSHAMDILIGTKLLRHKDLWISFRKRNVRIA